MQRKPPNSIKPNLEVKTAFCKKVTTNQVSTTLEKLGFEYFENQKKIFQEKKLRFRISSRPREQVQDKIAQNQAAVGLNQ